MVQWSELFLVYNVYHTAICGPQMMSQNYNICLYVMLFFHQQFLENMQKFNMCLNQQRDQQASVLLDFFFFFFVSLPLSESVWSVFRLFPVCTMEASMHLGKQKLSNILTYIVDISGWQNCNNTPWSYIPVFVLFRAKHVVYNLCKDAK